jgi:hypothetical protein
MDELRGLQKYILKDAKPNVGVHLCAAGAA